MPAAHRARAVVGQLAAAESLAALIRDHGHPARVVVGRRQGTVRIRVASPHRGRRAPRALLPVCRTVVLDWLTVGAAPTDLTPPLPHP
jgi:hypothetical protein